ncbi:MAG: glutamate--tRNA ligase [Ruminococcaceae bacterium]|nr:glutamate--tRNA ligase [Oscillospiraceae bacterium]
MTDFEKLAELLFPHIDKTIADYEEMYPVRNLSEGAKVTRFAPSPTGYMHIGNMFSCLIDRLAAATPDSVFYLRIEDTDKKREVPDAIDKIIEGLSAFGIAPTEGISGKDSEKGAYGPYKQSLRRDIYQAFAKELVIKGFAYPCFCTEEELSALRENQEKEGANPGYYGKYAACRNLTVEQQEEKIKAGIPYTVRLRSDGDENRKIIVEDQIKGKIEMPENIQDLVLLKTDGIPTYHFAHAVDDHLMRTTHVVRGDEWISSLPLHIQLFKLLGYKPPKFAHISPIMKLDEGNKRKLSKRKDPEASVSFYVEQGFPADGVIEYLMTLANSNFEDWRKANPAADKYSFPFSFKKMSSSGALFDILKLNDICKNVISLMTAEEVYNYTVAWAKDFDRELYDLFTADPEFAKRILNIDRETPKPRKDIICWSDVKGYVEYFYDSLYKMQTALPENIAHEDAKAVIDAYKKVFDENDDKDTWFSKIKELCEPLGFTPNVKEYKKNPDAFKGHVGDVSTVIRVAVTGRTNTPDLHAILSALGKERVFARLDAFKATL